MKLGDLTLTQVIGKGNFGQVYLTVKKGYPQYLATKVLDRRICEKPENKNRLLYEINLIHNLNHPNILKCLELKKTTNHWFIVTEYCNGGSLNENLAYYISKNHRPFPEEVVQYFMKQILKALEYLHLNKIIHRDLKLDNILLNYNSEQDRLSRNLMAATIKIIDFGFATQLSKDKTFTVLGTPTNMDPKILEQLNTPTPNTGYNEQVDIWSLGTLCYEMVVGHKPFSGQSMQELYSKVKQGVYKLPPTLSREIVDFIDGMLKQDLNKRLNARQLLLHDFLNKPISQFHPIDMRYLKASIGPGGTINMKSKEKTNQPQYQYQMMLWEIYNQPDVIQKVPQNNTYLVQPQPQLNNQVINQNQYIQTQMQPLTQPKSQPIYTTHTYQPQRLPMMQVNNQNAYMPQNQQYYYNNSPNNYI